MENTSTVPVSEAMLALAFVGDLSKGQSIFRKLQCSTRAAATLKAYTLRII
jgi:hypothetical protein